MKSQILVVPSDIRSSTDGYRIEGVFNPGAIEVGNEVHLLLRVAERPDTQRAGYIPLPRYQIGTGYLLDWVKRKDVSILDSRGVLEKDTGRHRFMTISHLRHAVSQDGLSVKSIVKKPSLMPKETYEEFGIEDARITKIDNIYYITYVVASRYGIATALASTKNFKSYKRYGIIFPPENKDIVIFPKKIGGYYYALHRPYGATPLGVPQIWLSKSYNLINWGQHKVLRRKIERPESLRFGIGPPPLKLKDGWLVIYHSVENTPGSRGPGKYLIYALLLELNNPSKVVAESMKPILQTTGIKNLSTDFKYVIFPTGAIRKGSNIFIYCGENDTFATVSKFSLQDLLNSMQ